MPIGLTWALLLLECSRRELFVSPNGTVDTENFILTIDPFKLVACCNLLTKCLLRSDTPLAMALTIIITGPSFLFACQLNPLE